MAERSKKIGERNSDDIKVPKDALPVYHDRPELMEKDLPLWLDYIRMERGRTGGKIEDDEDRWSMSGGGKDESWVYDGYDSVETEFGEKLLNEIVCFALDRIKERDGQLNLVSLGGAHLVGVLGLRELIREKFGEISEDKKPKIKLVDYSLTKNLGKRGLVHAEKEGIDTSDVVLRAGPFHVKRIYPEDKKADLIVSNFGPTHHERRSPHITQLFVKIATMLDTGGRAYIEEAVIPISGYGYGPSVEDIQKDLGDDFFVKKETFKMGSRKRSYRGYLVIERKEDKIK